MKGSQINSFRYEGPKFTLKGAAPLIRSLAEKNFIPEVYLTLSNCV